MRNLFKKALAFCLVAALALTCFAGTFYAAESYTATISVDSKTITLGTETVDVVLNISSPAAGINEALFKVSSDLGTVTAVDVAEDDIAIIDYATNDGETVSDYGSFYLSAKNTSDGENGTVLGSINAATITVTFAVAAGVGEYPINIETSGVKAASKDEDVITLSYETAKVIVEAPHTHTYVYTPNAGDTHTYDCSTCENFDPVTEACTITDGACIYCLDPEEVAGPVYKSDLKVKAKNALFQSDYSLMFAIPTATAEGWYLVVEQVKYDGNTKIDPRVVTLTADDNYKTQNVNGTQCYTVLLTGIGAKDVASEINITLYAEVDGVMSYGPTESYNLVSYATKQITSGTASGATTKKQNFAKAMVAFLNYAAAAQNRFGYNNSAENLANASLSEEVKALAPLASEPVNYRNDAAVVIDNPTSAILAYAPQYKDKITLSVLVDAPEAQHSDLYLQIDYTDSKGVAKTDRIVIADGTDTSYQGAIEKQINFTSVSFADVRTNINLKVVDSDGNAVSNTGIYSFESYAASRKTTSKDYDAARALVNFGDYIKIYFNN